MIPITRSEHSATDLRRLAAKAEDGDRARRLLAIALIMDGRSRTEAAEQCGMQRQTLRDWVHRYNETGADGLQSRAAPGPTPLLKAEEMADLRELIIAGPDREQPQVVRWRCKDLCAEVRRRFDLSVHERTIGKWLHRLDMRRLQPRPFHPKKDAAAQETFKKTSSLP